MMNAVVPSARLLLLLLTTVCSVAFLGRNGVRCCVVADGDDVMLATVADGIVLAAVVTVTADDDDGTDGDDNADDCDDDARELGRSRAALIPASRTLRVKPTRTTATHASAI